MILKLFLLLGMICFIGMFLSQVFLPAWNNRKLFPMFRDNNWKTKRKIVDANTRKHLAKQRIEAAESDVDAAEMEFEADKLIDEKYNSLINDIELGEK